MTVTRNAAEVAFANVVAGTPISCLMKLPSTDQLIVYYGKSRGIAVGTDYAVTLNPNLNDYEDFIITPTAALIAKINMLIADAPGVESNIIYVARTYDLLTAFSVNQSFSRDNIMREFDRTAMRFQQIARDLLRYSAPTDQLTAAMAAILNVQTDVTAKQLAAAASAAAAAASAAIIASATTSDANARRTLTATIGGTAWQDPQSIKRLVRPAWVNSVGQVYPCQSHIFPTACWGFGLGVTLMSKGVKQAALDSCAYLQIPYNRTEVWIDGIVAHDGTGAGTQASPWGTLAKAFSVLGSSTINMLPSSVNYAPSHIRVGTEVGAGEFKRLKAPSGGVTVGFEGTAANYPKPSALTFASLGGGTPDCYSCTVAAMTAGSSIVRVIDVHNFDIYGQPIEMPWYSSIGGLQAAGYGFYWNTGAKQIVINYAAANVNTLAAAGRFKFMYLDSTGIAEMVLGAAHLMIDAGVDDIVFEGLALRMGKVGGTYSNLFMQGGVYRWAPSNTLVHEGGLFYASKTRSHSPIADHFNYNTPSTTGAGVVGMGIEHDLHTTAAGSLTYVPPSQNCNASSAHGATHVIRAGGFHDGHYGPIIADVDDPIAIGYSWNVGVLLGHCTAPASQQFEFAGAKRIVLNDSCVCVSGETYSMNVDTGATVYGHQNKLPNTIAVSAGSYTQYDRSAPPV